MSAISCESVLACVCTAKMFVKCFVFLGVALVFVGARPGELRIKGGVSTLSGDSLKEAESVLTDSLTKLAAGDGPNYKLSKIISATHQVVSGSLYKFKVELTDSENAVKNCDVAIWSQPWLENGIEVTFECPGDAKLVKKHSA